MTLKYNGTDSDIDLKKQGIDGPMAPQVIRDDLIRDMDGSIGSLNHKITSHPRNDYELLSKLTYHQLQSNPILDIAARVWEEEPYQAAKHCR